MSFRHHTNSSYIAKEKSSRICSCTLSACALMGTDGCVLVLQIALRPWCLCIFTWIVRVWSSRMRGVYGAVYSLCGFPTDANNLLSSFHCPVYPLSLSCRGNEGIVVPSQWQLWSRHWRSALLTDAVNPLHFGTADAQWEIMPSIARLIMFDNEADDCGVSSANLTIF